MLFTNKHFIAALIVAPILAVLAYLGTDQLVSDKAKKAEAGSHYKLLALPNCRYSSGLCVMKNGNFKIEIVGQPQADGELILQLESDFALQQVNLAVAASPDAEQAFSAMLPVTDDGLTWQLSFAKQTQAENHMRVVVQAGDALYYGDSLMPFINYETSFGKDFRHAQN